MCLETYVLIRTCSTNHGVITIRDSLVFNPIRIQAKMDAIENGQGQFLGSGLGLIC